ncbi:MAG: MG2 domain-containing protein, partial [Candidatus Omnitrophota bacterium]
MRKLFLFTAVIVAVCLGYSLSSSQAYEESMKQQGDQHWMEKSYQMAIPQYQAALKSRDIPEKIEREIQFKLADCLWRAGGEAQTNQAEKRLKELISSRDHDRWWAEANESLAGYYFQKDRWSHSEEIKEALVNAREFWAGETDIKLARPRFIQASFTLGDFVSQNWGWYYTGIRRTRLSGDTASSSATQEQGLNVLYEEILQVAETDADKAKAHYSLAMSHLNRGYGEEEKKLVQASFEKIIEEFPDSEWADDAYYNLGQFYERANDFNQAIAAYRGLLTHFRRGDSPWVDNAQQQLKEITEPRINVGISYTFLPDSQVQFNLGWRNVNEAIFTLYKLDLPRVLQMDPTRPETDSVRGIDNYSDLIHRLVTSKQYVLLPKERAWRRPLKDEGKHLWYGESRGLAEWLSPEETKDIDIASGVLAPGAYLLFVSAGQASAYDLILVTDMGLVTKVAGQSALFYTFDSKTGVPRGDVNVKYHYRYYNDRGEWLWEEGAGVTDGQGLLHVPIKTPAMRNYGNQHNLFACVSDGQMQAFAQGYFYAQSRGRGDWWLYAFSDRPAYHPGEEISFKGTLRKYNGAEFTNPDGMPVKVRLYDARGNIVKEGDYRLNAYGSFTDTLVLDENATLGEYSLQVLTPNNDQLLTQAVLFRLEEYKLPEFVVSVRPKPKEDKSGPVAYRLGDEVEVEIDAQYYFGGPVPRAEVEYLIYASPYYHSYQPPQRYPWYYEDMQQRYQDYGPGSLIKKETISTDEQGKASFVFQSPQDSPHDLKYRVEVRVVDQSRREVSSTADIKVTRNSFFAYLTPQHNLYRPGDKAEVNIKVLTANDEPLVVDGKVAVLKNWWQEPVLEKGQVVRGGDYSKNELFTRFVKTDDKGEATVDFQPEEEGYYTLEFTGYDRDGREVK